MHLKPSKIRFSQDSISNYFDKRSSHRNKSVGDTLDDLCEGRCSIRSIPTITVVKEDGRWVSADNRRLWVFRELERLGKCDTIPVHTADESDEPEAIPEYKRTSDNRGRSIRVRGNPGGIWYLKPDARVSRSARTERMGSSGLNEIDSLGLRMARMRLKTDESEQVSRINSSGSRVSRYSYGVRIRKSYIPGEHPKERKCVVDGEKMCRGCFDKHIEKRQKIEAGQSFCKKRYYPHSSNPKRAIYIYRSARTYQTFTDDPSCSYIGKVKFDLSDVPVYESRAYEVKMVYDGSEIRVTVRVIATGQRFKAKDWLDVDPAS